MVVLTGGNFIKKITTGDSKMWLSVVINKVVGLMRFPDKKTSELLFGQQKSGCNKGVVILTSKL